MTALQEHFDIVLDLGFDYGADGGHGWDTTLVRLPSGYTYTNQRRSAALGEWQLGNRRLTVDELATLRGFFHAVRGRTHTFLYRDWNDYRAVQEPLPIDGSAETQLVKTYGLAINPWVREIHRPDADTVLIELATGGGDFVALEPGTDYTLGVGGVVTWLITPPEALDQVRWTGEFFVRARFDRDRLDAQFIAADGDEIGSRALYELGTLGVMEEPD